MSLVKVVIRTRTNVLTRGACQ